MNAIFRTITTYILLLLISGSVNAANITAMLDRESVYDGESVKLTLEVNGSVDGRPDFKPLEKDFEIMSRNKSSSMQFINGKMSSKVQWILTLMPKRKGQLHIPAIYFGHDKSNAIIVHVKPAQTSKAGTEAEDVFLQVGVEPSAAYVQSQIIYTIRIYVGVRMNDASLSEPALSHADAVIEKLGEDKRFETMHLGRRYHVIERHYALFPQQSGKLRIDPVVFSGRIVSNPSRFMSPFNQYGQDRRIQSKVIEIDVKPVPAGQQAKAWLPASSIKLQEQWPQDPPRFKVGEAVTRTLVLTAEGLTAAQLPELNKTVPDGFKTYPDQAKLDDLKQSSGITGQRTEKIAMIANRPGKHYLPEIKINWWNTRTNKAEVARIPARQIIVLAVEGSQKPVITDMPKVQFTDKSTTPPISTSAPVTSNIMNSGYWPWLSLGLAIAWLTTLGFVWYQSRQKMFLKEKPQRDLDEITSTTLKQAENKIKQACINNDVVAAKEALLRWAALCFPDENVTSLGDVVKYLDENASGPVIELNKSLYSQSTGDWNGAELLKSIKPLFKNKSGTQKTSTSTLAALYPG